LRATRWLNQASGAITNTIMEIDKALARGQLLLLNI